VGKIDEWALRADRTSMRRGKSREGVEEAFLVRPGVQEAPNRRTGGGSEGEVGCRSLPEKDNATNHPQRPEWFGGGGPKRTRPLHS